MGDGHGRADGGSYRRDRGRPRWRVQAGWPHEAVRAGRVRLNGECIKPAKDVRTGDVVEVRLGEVRWMVVIREVADKRGSAPTAATLYEETAESITESERTAEERRLSRPLGADANGARPTKRDRRQIQALRRGRRGWGAPGRRAVTLSAGEVVELARLVVAQYTSVGTWWGFGAPRLLRAEGEQRRRV